MKRFVLFSALLLVAAPLACAIIDDNQNGMSDVWEKHYNNGPLMPPSFLAIGDDDGDGILNGTEAINGTNPFVVNPPEDHQPDFQYSPAVYFGVDANGDPAILTPAAMSFTWATVPGKLYRLQAGQTLQADSWLQTSPDLLADQSTNTFSIANTLTQPDGTQPQRMFWRVSTTDIDSDGDGLTDAEEYLLGGDPLIADTDNDGLSDYQEYQFGGDPNNTNTDGDRFPDGEDAAPDDPAINWAKTPEPDYVFLEAPGWDLELHGQPIMTNNKGALLCQYAVWEDGVWTRLTCGGSDPPWSDKVILPGYTFTATGNDGVVRTVPIILYRTEANSIDDQGIISGKGDADYAWPDTATDAHSHVGGYVFPIIWTTPSAFPTLVNSPANITGFIYGQAYINRSGMITYRTYEPEGWKRCPATNLNPSNSQSSGFENLTSFCPRDGTSVGREYVRNNQGTVTGLVANPCYWFGTGESATITSSNTLDPSGGSIDFSGFIYALGTTPPMGESASEEVERSIIKLGDSALIHNGQKWVKSKSLANASTLSKYGSALLLKDDEPAVWRNSKTAKIKDLCPSLADKGITHFEAKDINDNGSILIQSNGTPPKLGMGVPLWIDGVDTTVDPANLEAPCRGVDNISHKADKTPNNGHQSGAWIMAPIASANTVRFRSGASPSLQLHLSADNATFTPAVLNSPDQQVTVTGTGTATSESNLVVKFGTQEITNSIRVKAMKKRTVKVTVHSVTLLTEGAPSKPATVVPDPVELQNYLNSIFLPQLNASFTVKPIPAVDPLNWDIATASDLSLPGIQGSERIHPGNETLDFGKSNNVEKEDKYIDLALRDSDVDINVYVVGGGRLCAWGIIGNVVTPFSGAAGMAKRDANAVFIDGNPEAMNQVKNLENMPTMLATIAHEIGHCLIGLDHPETGGPAPHKGSSISIKERKERLMYPDSLPIAGKRIVKSEWDAAEIWLKSRRRGDN
ncbi:MAG: hypothetical protein H8M99_12085 [Gloeobacteraceae cyanobacterium ES-bin-144]|nr:hypothetical protein [Verrucomicrobiales bacterium]